MASGKNVTTFAVPALRPLVMHLFMWKGSKPSDEMSTQREVSPVHMHNHSAIVHIISTSTSFFTCKIIQVDSNCMKKTIILIKRLTCT